MSDELQTVFEAVIRAVKCVENSPSRGKLFAELCDVMEAEHTVLPYYCVIHWLSCAKVLHRVFEVK
jgi:hypothetical protein